jgi:hypothetical protein
VTWFKVDDSFSEHPKLEGLEGDPVRFMAAISVWTLMGSDCARRLTDGKVSRARFEKVLAGLGKHAPKGADALVECGLWEVAPGGWVFHDWADYQPTKADVDGARRSKTERQRRWRGSKQAEQTGENHKDSQTEGASVGGRVDALVDVPVDASTTASRDALRVDSRDAAPSRPVPTRPVPTRPPLTTFEGENARARATPGVVSGSHMQEFGEMLRAEAFANGYTASPRLVGSQLREAADRAREISERTGESYPDAARKLIRSALEAARKTGKAVGLLLLDIEPSSTTDPKLSEARDVG